MQCHVHPNNGIPIYEQICRQVRFAVANESLAVGEHVPSVRELATRLAVNANTVARAYRELQSDGILLPIRGTGLAVAPGAVRLCQKTRLKMIRERLRSVLQEAQQNDVTKAELRELFESEWKSLKSGKR